MGSETGVTRPQAQEHLELRELEEAGRILPCSLQREHGPADTLILDF